VLGHVVSEPLGPAIRTVSELRGPVRALAEPAIGPAAHLVHPLAMLEVLDHPPPVIRWPGRVHEQATAASAHAHPRECERRARRVRMSEDSSCLALRRNALSHSSGRLRSLPSRECELHDASAARTRIVAVSYCPIVGPLEKVTSRTFAAARSFIRFIGI
jgi:hypothetical protein